MLGCLSGQVAKIVATGILLSGCATQVVTAPTAKNDHVAERQALAHAARGVEPVAWTASETTSFADRLLGVAKERSLQPQKSETIESYVEILAARQRPVEALEQDATRQLEAARRLIDHAEMVLATVEPRMGDVGLLESAIADLRQSRGVYLSALRRLDGRTTEDTSLARIRVKTGFDVAIRQVGDLASALADQAMAFNAPTPAAQNRFRLTSQSR